MPDDNCCPVSLIRLRIELAVLEGSNVSEPVRQGKSFVPPKGAAILMGDPLPGLTAQDFADGLDDSLSDHDLAEAIALVCNKVSHLLHLVEEGEASRDELDEWLVLENKLCQEALERGGSISGEGPGLMGMIAPFMERNGYRDAWAPAKTPRKASAQNVERVLRALSRGLAWASAVQRVDGRS